MSWKYRIQDSFEKSSQQLFSHLKADEEASLSIDAEDSEFIRFNKGKVRQATAVEQAQAHLIVQTKNKMSKASVPVTGDLNEDRKRFLLSLGKIRQELEVLPENPHPIQFVESGISHTDLKADTPKAEFIVDKVAKSLSASDDFIGYMAAGPLMMGIANSRGTRHWHSSDLYFVDYSLFYGKQGEAKAVTANVSGNNWDELKWAQSLTQSKLFLQQLQKPARQISRGDYRVYLAPAAVCELKNIISWGGFSQAAYKQGWNGLRLLAENEKKLSDKLSLIENFDLGVHPHFNSLGELSPKKLAIIEKGQLRNFLTSAKTAVEYGIPSNGANNRETPVSLEILPGHLSQTDIYKSLDTGLYLSNLHYVNWSDQKTARLTGMTRFGCFWVEKGEIVAPINDMRFDVSLYDIWGDSGLIDLTDFQNTSVNISTYENRAFGGEKLPGMLIEGFKFTL